MNCCKNNKDDNGEKYEHKKGHMPHIIMMAFCCGAPILLFLLLPFISKLIPDSYGVLALIAPFLCPLLMLPMMISMLRERKNDQNKSHNIEDSNNHSDSGNYQ